MDDILCVNLIGKIRFTIRNAQTYHWQYRITTHAYLMRTYLSLQNEKERLERQKEAQAKQHLQEVYGGDAYNFHNYF